jgi:hypothetical protein
MEWEGADLIRGDQDWDKWRALVNMVTKLLGIWPAEELRASQEQLCSREGLNLLAPEFHI